MESPPNETGSAAGRFERLPAGPQVGGHALESEVRAVRFQYDPTGMRFVSLAEGMADLFGHDLETWQRPGFWSAQIFADDGPTAALALSAACHRPEGGIFEYRLRDAAGRERSVRHVLEPTNAPAPRLRSGYLVDITQRRGLERRVRELESAAAVGRLTTGVAHDFNNLFMALLWNLEHVRQAGDSGSDTAESRAAAIDCARRGSDLAQRLVAVAKGQSRPARTIDLIEVVGGVVVLLGRALGPSVELSAALPEAAAAVEVDPGQLQCALVNLLANARDAIRGEGTIAVKVEMSVTTGSERCQVGTLGPGPYVVVSVRDDGPGIPADRMQRLFDPFVTIGKGESGTGLGLAMVADFATSSGGAVRVASEVGRGATFSIHLPARF